MVAFLSAAALNAAPGKAATSFVGSWAKPLSGAMAPRAVPKPQVGSAYVYTFKHQEEADGYCSGGDAGIIRWPAVKGVDSYTVVFNDAAYGGAEQRVAAAADADGNWPGDKPPEGATYPAANAPKGEHQLIWTGGSHFGPGPCQPDNTDYSTRLTNARVEYTPVLGEISGRVADPRGHGVPDVRIDARGKASLGATTDFEGYYSIDIPKDKLGTYEVAPHGKGFDPESTRVKADAGKKAEANFRSRCGGGGAHGRAAILNGRAGFTPKGGLYSAPQQQKVDMALYYNCAKQTLRAQADVAFLSCDAGGTIAVPGFQVGKKLHLSGHSFAFQAKYVSAEFSAGGDRLKDVRVKVNGEFTTDTAANLRFSYSGHRESDSSYCAEAGRYSVHLADVDPSPFGGD